MITVADALACWIAQNIYKAPAGVNGNAFDLHFTGGGGEKRERESIKTTSTTIDYGRAGKKGGDWGIEGQTKQLNSAFVVRFASSLQKKAEAS